ncbi:hypothetical protein AB205_0008390 [Aquarana catesbeiana]|uniref:Myb/SANT-like DNA-binding domain-containing protein n=2 Tax=Aquarana catesbeiana TaxID=8400 RepID=A0A2G9RJW7_AQUCT|nr:hypothetical protein AB205_0008390 [Aquarana catesbeiana]
MRETQPAPDLLYSIFPTPSPPLLFLRSGRAHEKEKVHEDSSNDKSPEPRMSRSRRRFKASNMSFVEMVEMVDILKRADYDGKHGPYPNPNVRKAKIMTKVVKSLHRNFGVQRSKDQLRKRWSDLKLREHDQYRRIKRVLQKREKKIGTSEDTRDPQPPKEGEFPKPQHQDVEEGEVYEVGEIVTTRGDVDVVEEETHFTSAHVLIGEIMVCKRDLQKMKEDINDVEKRLKNIIDVLGRI